MRTLALRYTLGHRRVQALVLVAHCHSPITSVLIAHNASIYNTMILLVVR